MAGNAGRDWLASWRGFGAKWAMKRGNAILSVRTMTIYYFHIYIYIIYIYTHSCYLTVKRAFFSDWLLGIRISKNHDLLDLPRIKRSQRKPEATLFQAVTQITVVKLHIG